MTRVRVLGFNGKVRKLKLPIICIWSKKASLPEFFQDSPKGANYGVQVFDPMLPKVLGIPIPAKTKKETEDFVAGISPRMFHHHGRITLWYLAPDGKELIINRESK